MAARALSLLAVLATASGVRSTLKHKQLSIASLQAATTARGEQHKLRLRQQRNRDAQGGANPIVPMVCVTAPDMANLARSRKDTSSPNFSSTAGQYSDTSLCFRKLSAAPSCQVSKRFSLSWQSHFDTPLIPLSLLPWTKHAAKHSTRTIWLSTWDKSLSGRRPRISTSSTILVCVVYVAAFLTTSESVFCTVLLSNTSGKQLLLQMSPCPPRKRLSHCCYYLLP